MISYKQWKLLQENLDSVIGIRPRPTIGIMGESPLMNMNMKKKPPMPPMGAGDSGSDEDDLDDDHLDADAEDADADAEDADADAEDADADAEDADAEDADMGGADAAGAEAGMGGMGPMGGGKMPPMKKKPPMPPMPPSMMHSYMKKEAKDVEDEDMKKADKKDSMKLQKDKCCNKCSCQKKENNEFLNNLYKQTGAVKFQQDEYGYWIPVKEDVLITPDEPKVKDTENTPGTVGFAPQQKLGTSGGFTEWSNRHTKKAKKKK